MQPHARDICEQICEVGRRLWMRGWVAANDGNISVRLEDGSIICTPTGVSKGFMTPDMLVTVDPAGGVIHGDRKPSSELALHLVAYRRREDIHGVVHAHPPYGTAFAVANLPLDVPVLPEIVLTLGSVPLARYATPSTPELAETVGGLLAHHDAVLMANHGVVTLGADVMTACFRMESVELYAQVLFAARQLGNVRTLTDAEVRQLDDVREAVRDRFNIRFGEDTGHDVP